MLDAQQGEPLLDRRGRRARGATRRRRETAAARSSERKPLRPRCSSRRSPARASDECRSVSLSLTELIAERSANEVEKRQSFFSRRGRRALRLFGLYLFPSSTSTSQPLNLFFSSSSSSSPLSFSSRHHLRRRRQRHRDPLAGLDRLHRPPRLDPALLVGGLVSLFVLFFLTSRKKTPLLLSLSAFFLAHSFLPFFSLPLSLSLPNALIR